MNTLPTIQSNVPAIPSLEKDFAEFLSDFLPVNLRDFWLGIDKHVQHYLYHQSSSSEHFFTLIQMEYARFEKKNKSYDWASNTWRQRQQH